MLIEIGFALVCASVGSIVSSFRFHSSFNLEKFFLSACKTLGLMITHGSDIALPSVNKTLRYPWGTRLIIGLPVGLSSKKVIDQQQAIAEALRVPSGDVEMRYSDDGLIMDIITAPMPKRVPYTLETPQKGSRVFIGVNRRGEPVLYDFKGSYPHLLIGGISGGGKSVMLRSIITQLASGPALDLYLNDLKGGVELGLFRALACTKSFETSLQGVRTAANAVEERMYSRYHEMAAKGWQQWKGQQIIFVIDELADFKARAGDPEAKLKNEIKSIITRLSAKGRAAGVILVLATQRPSADVVCGISKANIATSICFRTRDAIQSRIVLDHDGAAALPDIPGRLIFQEAREETLQGPYLSAEEAKQIIAHLPKKPIEVENEQFGSNTTTSSVLPTVQADKELKHSECEPNASKALPLVGNSIEL